MAILDKVYAHHSALDNRRASKQQQFLTAYQELALCAPLAHTTAFPPNNAPGQDIATPQPQGLWTKEFGAPIYGWAGFCPNHLMLALPQLLPEIASLPATQQTQHVRTLIVLLGSKDRDFFGYRASEDLIETSQNFNSLLPFQQRAHNGTKALDPWSLPAVILPTLKCKPGTNNLRNVATPIHSGQ